MFLLDTLPISYYIKSKQYAQTFNVSTFGSFFAL